MKEVILVSGLTKSFKSKVRVDGKFSFIRNLFSQKYKETVAVDNLNLKIKEGELIGFIGPNGAGKSTTIKMLSGILYPDKGSIKVLGLNPQKDRIKLLYQIGTIFGQKQQLWFHLTPLDSFKLFRDIYDIRQEDFEKRLEELVDLLQIRDYLDKPVRKLSLGERMRCELVAALLHRPKILFLDEPTIGMDLIAKKRLREFIKKINSVEKTTILLTSHDMDDIEKLCSRIVIINHGKIIYDGSLESIKSRLKIKRIEFLLDKSIDKISNLENVKVINKEKYSILLEVDTSKVTIREVIDFYLEKYSVVDINILEVPIEEIIETFYKK